MGDWKYGYPNVECAAHMPAPGYAVCKHVLDGATADFVEAASLTSLGQILCGPCSRDPSPGNVEELLLVCSHCAMAKGWLTSKDLS